MNWELSSLIEDFEVIKERLDDLKTIHGWFDDKNFIYEANHFLTEDEVIRHGMKYHEHRIHQSQTNDLMRIYLEQLDDLIRKFKQIEKRVL